MPRAITLLEITTVRVCLDSLQTESRNFKLTMGPTVKVRFNHTPQSGPRRYLDTRLKESYECQEEEYITDSIIVNTSSAILWIADIDECVDAGRCGPFSKCNNTNGSFICSCIRGYTSPAGPWFMPKRGTDCRGENCKVTLCSQYKVYQNLNCVYNLAVNVTFHCSSCTCLNILAYIKKVKGKHNISFPNKWIHVFLCQRTQRSTAIRTTDVSKMLLTTHWKEWVKY